MSAAQTVSTVSPIQHVRHLSRSDNTHQVVHATLDRLAERKRLALASDDDNNLARVQYRLDTDGERHAGHLAHVVPEEARVGEDGVVRERLDARARLEGRTRLVERDVPVLADTAEEELDAAVRGDLGLVGLALEDEVLGVAVQDVDLGRRDVDWWGGVSEKFM